MTVPVLLRKTEDILSKAGVDNPKGDSAEITAAVLGIVPNALRLLADREVTDEEAAKAEKLANLRSKGEPIQYVIGSWSFMGRDFKVGRGVLIPRDDTEVVVNEALMLMKNVNKPTVADLCSGSGIIGITLEKELNEATVFAVEKSDAAYKYLTENIELNSSKVNAVLGDLYTCCSDFEDNSFDLIISNPPYIRTDEICTLQKEVQAEPKIALDGGHSGYDFYKGIISLWTNKLKKGGYIAFEIGEGQFEYICELLTENGCTDIQGHPDIQGITRAVTAKKSD